MAHAYHRTRQAQIDLAELSDWLGQQSPALALRFLQAAKQTFELLAAHPGIGGKCHFPGAEFRDIRVWRVTGFPNHLIFYRRTDDGVQIARVLHAARNLDDLFGSP
ncbi:MAG: type II toxin-antitoxin system RelE/ParE family toxin [Planctomycetes bacterium]|nr:type II toxin-antitoxin system RelE/ParE family toxin [Planctomycetota bacterium]